VFEIFFNYVWTIWITVFNFGNNWKKIVCITRFAFTANTRSNRTRRYSEKNPLALGTRCNRLLPYSSSSAVDPRHPRPKSPFLNSPRRFRRVVFGFVVDRLLLVRFQSLPRHARTRTAWKQVGLLLSLFHSGKWGENPKGYQKRL